VNAQLLTAAVAELDQRIINDSSFGPKYFQQLVSAQKELGLLHGDRPTCPFLRPHILSRDQYSSVSLAAEIIARAFEKLVASALADAELMMEFGLSAAELKLARLNPGYSTLCVTSRLDAYVTESGFKFLEYNAESPAGVGDQMQLEKILFELHHTRDFLERHAHWCPEPHRRLLRALNDAYRDWGGEEERPQIAIIDWKDVATASEFRVLQRYFESEGQPTIIADPNELEYDGDRLRAGNFRIDIVYKRVVIHEFLERFDETHALPRAYSDGRVCMANSFRSKVAHKKAGFAILTDPAYEHLFSPEEIQIFRRHIPWTRWVRTGTTMFEDAEHDLPTLIRLEKDRLVLKPNDDYGGHGVFIGWESDAESWDAAIKLALKQPYVVQERVPLKKLSIPMFTDHVQLEEMFIDFNPFLFCNRVEGALVRLSSSSLLNVTSGGGQTALLVVEDL